MSGKITTIDFETLPIRPRPHYPPKPVGVAVHVTGWPRSKYLAWGHPTGNNCDKRDAMRLLEWAWKNTRLLFWHAHFDLDVACEVLGLPWPQWDQVHDAMFLAFLDNPHRLSMSLKDVSKDMLNIKPEERDRVREWLLEHQPVPGVHIRGVKQCGDYIGYASGKVVAPYARGDVDRTRKLYAKLYKSVVIDRRMGEAYDRERQLIWPLKQSEREGFTVHDSLISDVAKYQHQAELVDAWIIKRLRAPSDLNINAGVQLIEAMLSAGVVNETELGTTPKTGKPKSDRESITRACTDRKLVAVLSYRGRLKTFLGTFMKPWLEVAEQTGGRVHTFWSSCRTNTGVARGAKTARLASTPNFQNIPNPKKHPPGYLDAPLKQWRPLPNVRAYVAPHDGHVLIGRDYNQQEVRILAHFEDGELLDQYNADPWLDVHTFVQGLINTMLNASWERRDVKAVVFGLLYGMGLGALGVQINRTVNEAKTLRDAVYAVVPGLKELYKEMKRRAQTGEPFRTWGGREYHCEPSRMVDGRLRVFDYKMVNALVQGSAADVTKQAVINYDKRRARSEHLLLTVHDELLASVPETQLHTGMQRMRRAMEFDPLDMPLLSEGEWSTESWAALKDYDKKGVTA